MQSIEWLWGEKYRTAVLLGSVALIVTIAFIDAIVKPYLSLSLFYLFPIMIAAGSLPRWIIVTASGVCAVLSALFSGLPVSWIRMSFEALAFAGCGLFAGELFRNRRSICSAQERLRVLIETSPAAILAINSGGFIELANHASVELLMPRENNLSGMPVAIFLPDLHYAIRFSEKPQLRSKLQCRGHRGNGESFTADVWLSTYTEDGCLKLAAIVVDASEITLLVGPAPLSTARAEVNPREQEILRLVLQGKGNKEIAGQMQLSESTIKGTLQQLFAKTGVRTRAQLVRVALEQYRDLI